jgi:hypothetical protein
MAGSPKKRERRERATALMAKDNFMPELCEYISNGGSLVQFAIASQIPYGRLHQFIAEDEVRKQQLDVARRARAMWHVDRIETLADSVEQERIDPHAAKVASDIRRWVASRLDMQQWGDKVQQKIEITDTTKLHLEAVRNLMKTVSVQMPEKLTSHTATDADSDARDSSDANANENHSHLD